MGRRNNDIKLLAVITILIVAGLYELFPQLFSISKSTVSVIYSVSYIIDIACLIFGTLCALAAFVHAPRYWFSFLICLITVWGPVFLAYFCEERFGWFYGSPIQIVMGFVVLFLVNLSMGATKPGINFLFPLVCELCAFFMVYWSEDPYMVVMAVFLDILSILITMLGFWYCRKFIRVTKAISDYREKGVKAVVGGITYQWNGQDIHKGANGLENARKIECPEAGYQALYIGGERTSGDLYRYNDSILYFPISEDLFWFRSLMLVRVPGEVPAGQQEDGVAENTENVICVTDPEKGGQVARSPIDDVFYKMHAFGVAYGLTFGIAGPIMLIIAVTLILTIIFGISDGVSLGEILPVLAVALLALAGIGGFCAFILYAVLSGWKSSLHTNTVITNARDMGLYYPGFLEDVEADLHFGMEYVGTYLAISRSYVFGILRNDSSAGSYVAVVIPRNRIVKITSEVNYNQTNIAGHRVTTFSGGFNVLLNNGKTAMLGFGSRPAIEKSEKAFRNAGLMQ